MADYNRVIELEPYEADHYITRGIHKSLIGDYTGAMSDFDRAMDLQPTTNQAEYYFYRGKAKYNLQKYHGALVDLDLAIKVKGRGCYYDLRSSIKHALGDKDGSWEDSNWNS